MTEDRIQTLAKLYPKLRDFYLTSSRRDMFWSPIMLGGSRRPSFEEFVAHADRTWDRKYEKERIQKIRAQRATKLELEGRHYGGR